MSYGDFVAQIKERGASEVDRSSADKVTYFKYQGTPWSCTFRNQALMRNELADGYEMVYCLNRYCDRVT